MTSRIFSRPSRFHFRALLPLGRAGESTSLQEASGVERGAMLLSAGLCTTFNSSRAFLHRVEQDRLNYFNAARELSECLPEDLPFSKGKKTGMAEGRLPEDLIVPLLAGKKGKMTGMDLVFLVNVHYTLSYHSECESGRRQDPDQRGESRHPASAMHCAYEEFLDELARSRRMLTTLRDLTVWGYLEHLQTTQPASKEDLSRMDSLVSPARQDEITRERYGGNQASFRKEFTELADALCRNQYWWSRGGRRRYWADKGDYYISMAKEAFERQEAESRKRVTSPYSTRHKREEEESIQDFLPPIF